MNQSAKHQVGRTQFNLNQSRYTCISLGGQSSSHIVMLMVYLISQANATTAASILYYTLYSQQIARLFFLPILLNEVDV
jgi:hypothetical protein